MRSVFLSLFAVAALAGAPAFAKSAECARPAACATMAKAAARCTPNTSCNALLKVLKTLEAPTKCQRAQAPDLHAFTLCDKSDQDKAFEILSHLETPSAQRFFCSDRFKHMIARRGSLLEQYAYATVPYDPNSEDDEVGNERPYYFATMTDCRGVKP